MEAIEVITAACVGVSLAAACGFRVFVPAFVFSVAANTDNLPIELAESWAWVGSDPAMIALGIATGVEIAGYYVPWIDNMLDSIATPAAVVAGTLVTAAAMSGEFDPMMQWTGAVVGGGGSAAAVQTGTVLLRAVSTGTTGGLGNPVVSTGEAAGSTGLSILAIILAPIAALIVIVMLIWIFRKIFGKRKTPPTPPAPTDPPVTPAG